jgi:hypothetical protein
MLKAVIIDIELDHIKYIELWICNNEIFQKLLMKTKDKTCQYFDKKKIND